MKFFSLLLFLISTLAFATPSGSVGFYSKGWLDSNAHLNGSEQGLLKLFTERNRAFGNPAMIKLLGNLGEAYQQTFPVDYYEHIQIGDIAQFGGGVISKHSSHQTGLDADIVYLRKDRRETRPERGFDATFDERFVLHGQVTNNFDGARTWWLFSWLYKHGQIKVIFIDPALKAYFAIHSVEYSPNDVELRRGILSLLTSWPDHDDHFHLRLHCPVRDQKCTERSSGIFRRPAVP